MDIPPGFSTIQIVGKVYKLRKSLYRAKQTPLASLTRRAMVGMGYQ